MKHLQLITRLLLAFILLVFGFNKFFGFLPMPPAPEQAGQLLGAIHQSGYLFPTVALVQIGVGLLLVSGRFLALAAILLAPISVNITLFHLALDPQGILPALIVTVLNIAIIVFNAKSYSEVFKAKPSFA